MLLEVTLLTVFVAALITALATGLGALPLLFSRQLDDRWLSVIVLSVRWQIRTKYVCRTKHARNTCLIVQ